MKPCSKCKIEKDLSEFRDKGRTGRKQSWCKACQSAHFKAYYAENKNGVGDRIRARNVRVIKEHKRFIVGYLQTHPCVDCGESDVVVLEFDHIRGHKESSISVLVRSACSSEKLEEEMRKCEVRCANCHRRRTAKYLGYYKVVG